MDIQLSAEALADLVPPDATIMADEHDQPRAVMMTYPQLRRFSDALLGAAEAAKTERLPASDYRRLVACWNACAGFSVETLELSAGGKAPSLKEIFNEHGEIWKQRDTLLASLAEILPAYRLSVKLYDPNTDDAITVNARIAISKATN